MMNKELPLDLYETIFMAVFYLNIAFVIDIIEREYENLIQKIFAGLYVGISSGSC